MRPLLRKDLLILARSRLLLAVLVLYPVLIALLIGFAISRAPSRPRVAIVNETSPGETVQVGDRRVEVGEYARQLFTNVEPVQVGSRAQARRQVEDGRVLAAVVIPSDIAARVSSGTAQGQVEVLYNGDALEQSLVRAQLRSALAEANLGFSKQIQEAAAAAIDALVRGGNLGTLGAPSNLIGLEQIPGVLSRVIAHTPPGADREALERIAQFADFAAANLGVSKRVLASVGQPIAIHTELVHGRRTPLDSFAVVVAVAVSLMFLGVLLAAGGIALEREENVLVRLVRGLVSRTTLLVEKIGLAAACAFLVALAMLAGVGIFVSLDWGRFPEWLLALACGGLAFAALGTAVGSLARDARAASLVAFLILLPLIFLALVPAGAVGHGFYDVISAISFVFPFKAALQALDAAVNGASPSLGGPIAHLLVLTAFFGLLARAGLSRAL
jgi:ABC-type multidrug transport system permease subunit